MFIIYTDNNNGASNKNNNKDKIAPKNNTKAAPVPAEAVDGRDHTVNDYTVVFEPGAIEKNLPKLGVFTTLIKCLELQDAEFKIIKEYIVNNNINITSIKDVNCYNSELSTNAISFLLVIKNLSYVKLFKCRKAPSFGQSLKNVVIVSDEEARNNPGASSGFSYTIVSNSSVPTPAQANQAYNRPGVAMGEFENPELDQVLKMMDPAMEAAIRAMLQGLFKRIKTDKDAKNIWDKKVDIIMKLPTAACVKIEFNDELYQLAKRSIEEIISTKSMHMGELSTFFKDLILNWLLNHKFDSVKSPFLVGAPGIGKTYMAKRLVGAMCAVPTYINEWSKYGTVHGVKVDIKQVQATIVKAAVEHAELFVGLINVNSGGDESVYFGFKPTYVNANHGKILDALRWNGPTFIPGTKTPFLPVIKFILLDEVDKASSNKQGNNILNSFLNLFDFQSNAVRDEFLEVDLDFSKMVGFICAGNSDKISVPFLNRVTKVEIKPPTKAQKILVTTEKVQILLREKNFPVDKFVIEPAVIEYIVEAFVLKDVGFRSPERIVTSMVNRAYLEFLQHKKKIVVNMSNFNQYIDEITRKDMNSAIKIFRKMTPGSSFVLLENPDRTLRVAMIMVQLMARSNGCSLLLSIKSAEATYGEKQEASKALNDIISSVLNSMTNISPNIHVKQIMNALITNGYSVDSYNRDVQVHPDEIYELALIVIVSLCAIILKKPIPDHIIVPCGLDNQGFLNVRNTYTLINKIEYALNALQKLQAPSQNYVVIIPKSLNHLLAELQPQYPQVTFLALETISEVLECLYGKGTA